MKTKTPIIEIELCVGILLIKYLRMEIKVEITTQKKKLNFTAEH